MACGRVLRNTMFPFICCWAPHNDDSDPEPATLRTLQPPSVVSMALPASTVPHGPRGANEASDERALREIFSSSSSVRGYQAATPVGPVNHDRGGSFDIDFRFGSRSPDNKPAGRLEQLGHHIRQKLSESGLSKNSSKAAIKPAEPGNEHLPSSSDKRPDEHARLLSTSHRSTGLSDLLVSRTASEGGYDSDAKSIETAMLRSNAGTIKVSPAFARQALANSELVRAVSLRVNHDSPTRDEDKYIATQTHDRGRSQSSPLPQTPPKTTLSAALQMNSNESPSDVLQRISLGFANGTIKLPNTPELKAMRMPRIVEADQDWRLAFSAPRRASSLNKHRENVQSFLKTLNNSVEAATRASIGTTNLSEKHISLVSDLDPTFFQFLQDYGKGSPSGPVQEQFSDYIGTSTRNSAISLPREDSTPANIKAASDSDKDSVHLFNMRISQRLASNSVMPVLSPSHSNVGSFTSHGLSSDRHELSGGFSSFARFPSFITQEHNRRPSDPRTRQLFENGNATDRLQPRWKPVNSVGSFYSNPKYTELVRDDASSFYSSDAGLPASGAGSSANATRRNSAKNAYSLAVGGRSAAGGLPPQHAGMGQLTDAEEAAAWLRRNEANGRREFEEPDKLTTGRNLGRQRSISMPTASGSAMSLGTPTPKGRRLTSTDTNELMSEISVDVVSDRRNDALSMLSTGEVYDRRNEAFSEEDPPSLPLTPSVHLDSRRESAGWLSDGRRSGWGFNFVSKSPEVKLGHEAVSQTGDSFEDTPIHESVTNMWHRAVKKARKEELTSLQSSSEGLFPVAKFDRLGRRKSCTRSSASLNGFRREQARGRVFDSLHTPDRRRSRSENPADCLSIKSHRRPRSVTPGSFTERIRKLDAHPNVKDFMKTAKEKNEQAPPKRSLLDVRRFTTIGFSAERTRDLLNSSTPTRGFLSAWTRFPIHTKDERNGTAGEDDGVRAKDFATFLKGGNERISNSRASLFGLSQKSLSTNELGESTPGSWRLSAVSKNQGPKRARVFRGNGRSTGEVGVKRRKGFFQSIKKLYRSRSAELRNYITNHGHRSSISMSGNVEYPELEILPGKGFMDVMWRRDRGRVQSGENQGAGCNTKTLKAWRNSTDEDDSRKCPEWLAKTTCEGGEGIEHSESKTERTSDAYSMYTPEEGSLTEVSGKGGTNEEISRSFHSELKTCLGVHSLRSTSEPKHETGTSNQRQKVSEELRASTVDFANQLKEELSRASKELLRRVESTENRDLGADDVDERLEMPPKITECGLGSALGKNGSCEDVSGNGGVDGA